MFSEAHHDEIISWPLTPATDEDLDAVSQFLLLYNNLISGKDVVDSGEFYNLRDQCIAVREGVESTKQHFLKWSHSDLLAKSHLHARAYLHYTDFFSRLHAVPGSHAGGLGPNLDAVAHGPRLLRGQRDYRWHLTASIYRLGGEDRAKAGAALKAFTAVLLNELGDRDPARKATVPTLTQQTAVAIAQHYRLDTPLLDWTRDVDVAVAFACGVAPVQPDDSPYGAVLIINSDKAVELGAKVVFPPMFAERLYKQRGVFIEVDEADGEQLFRNCTRIIFPRPSKPLGYLSNLLPDNEYLQALGNWAQQDAPAEASGEQLRNDAAAYMGARQLSLSSLSNGVGSGTPTSQVEAAKELLDSVAFIGFEGERRIYDPRVIEAIRRDNPGFLEWLAANGGPAL